MFMFGSVFIVLYFLVYFVVSSYTESNGLPLRDLLQPHKWFRSEPIPTATPLPVPTSIPTPTSVPTIKPKVKTTTSSSSGTGSLIECIGPDGKQFNTSMDECKKLNEQWGKPVNYMTDCNYPPECGGGVKRESKIECDKPCTRTKVNTSNTNSTNTSSYVMVSLYGGDMVVWCKPEVVQALNDLYPQVQQSSKLWADTCVVASPPAQCDTLKQDANRKEDNYKSIFMGNCVNKK